MRVKIRRKVSVFDLSLNVSIVVISEKPEFDSLLELVRVGEVLPVELHGVVQPAALVDVAVPPVGGYLGPLHTDVDLPELVEPVEVMEEVGEGDEGDGLAVLQPPEGGDQHIPEHVRDIEPVELPHQVLDVGPRLGLENQPRRLVQQLLHSLLVGGRRRYKIAM